jgi:hypothetical protein
MMGLKWNPGIASYRREATASSAYPAHAATGSTAFRSSLRGEGQRNCARNRCEERVYMFVSEVEEKARLSRKGERRESEREERERRRRGIPRPTRCEKTYLLPLRR